jgi:quercetin dioxygenase-like cupin family protein
MEIFKVTRIYADAAGESRFEDVSYPLTDGGPIGYLSEKVKVQNLIFRKVPPGYDDLHNAPQRQYVILLDGAVEIEISTGEKRVFNPGDILLMEDTTGKGHRSRNVEPIERSSLFITFD